MTPTAIASLRCAARYLQVAQQAMTRRPCDRGTPEEVLAHRITEIVFRVDEAIHTYEHEAARRRRLNG